MKFLVRIFVGCLFFNPAMSMGSDFSCSDGKQGACLDYGDKVCSSYSKCVSENATCFQPNTCGYDGFICKSEYTNLSNTFESEYTNLSYEYDGLSRKFKNISEEHDNIVSEYDDLLEKHNRLLRLYKKVTEEHDNIVSEYDDFVEKQNGLLRVYKNLEECIGNASSLDKAQNCL
ncbi:MAG: hypothetical protein GY942_14800 [Aestuariibacter sp.]|nr:hypothetical protein [Aestuariibacter sp.]